MQHHIIKSLLFSASLSKVHRTFFTLALGAMLLTATVGCEKEWNLTSTPNATLHEI